MSDQCDLCLLGLIILSSLLTGTSGVDHVFISSGVDVRLSCNKTLSDCKSTSWIYYNRFRHSVADELINLGIKNEDTERHERLSLESDCSLNIKNVTEEDYGSYSCRQYVNGRQQGPDTHVYLHVLHVSVSPSSSSSSSSSSSQTEISPGRSVTLSCQLYSYTGYSCDDWVRYDGVELLWVNQAGVDLKTDSRYQISSLSPSSSSSSSSDRYNIITLTTTLLNEDNNREWRCQVTLRNQLQASVTYTVKYSAPVSSTTLTPVSRSNSEKTSSRTTATAPTQVVTTTTSTTVTARPTVTAGLLYRVIVSIVEMAVFAAPTVILLQIICARRAGRKNSRHPEEIEMPAIQQ
ncbi:uncharacterized protein LOC120475434 isoform X2 [Pimephales promelas]|uniref:uncharacterized protein LOC120475434 isoform X2 n=1 Tax=Pimephales promelas TaxID=90988 RepID=UPI001955A59E|nr:uncharacterized protein LOC120475434 isoform X2 [Pimephales promelas]